MISISLDCCEIKENREACESFVEAINEMVRGLTLNLVYHCQERMSRSFEGFRLIKQKFSEMFLSAIDFLDQNSVIVKISFFLKFNRCKKT